MKKKVVSPLAQQLREERILHRWSQQGLADRIGTTPVTISRWENSVSLPSPYFRLKLEQIFGSDFLNLGQISDEEIQEECEDIVHQEETSASKYDKSSQQEATASITSGSKPEERVPSTNGRKDAKTVLEFKKGATRQRILVCFLICAAIALTGGGSWFFIQQFQTRRHRYLIVATLPLLAKMVHLSFAYCNYSIGVRHLLPH